MVRKVENIQLIDKYIGTRIQELRLSLGLSRQQLGEKIEVTHQQLQKYEKGTNRVSAGRLAVIASFLNKPIAYFYEGVEVSTGASIEHVQDFEHQRMCIEVSRNFMKLKKPEHKDAVNSLVRSLANTEN
jgi:transcriptional regulator with XRE-family HTH domain